MLKLSSNLFELLIKKLMFIPKYLNKIPYSFKLYNWNFGENLLIKVYRRVNRMYE